MRPEERPAARAPRAASPASGGRGWRDPQSLGERPQPPWYPLPLAEILILVGGVATIIGWARGEAGHTTLYAGLAAVALGTLEITIREHFSGYRSHTILLSILPALVFHTVVILILVPFVRVPRGVNVALLIPDVAIFAVCFKYLRDRFEVARRERRFASGR